MAGRTSVPGQIAAVLRVIAGVLARPAQMLTGGRRAAPYQANRLTPWLLLGAAPSASEYEALARAGVTHVLDLRDEVDGYPAAALRHGIEYRRMPVINEQPPSDRQIADVTDWVLNEIVPAGGTLYVHCEGGIGRAPTCAMALLMHHGFRLSEAHRLVLAVRPVAAPSDQQIGWLEALDRRLTAEGARETCERLHPGGDDRVVPFEARQERESR